MDSKKNLFAIIAVIAVIFVGCGSGNQRNTVYASEHDWHQFLGPDRNSTSPQKGLLRSWSENGPEQLWSVDVGIGFGGPVVKNGKVYLLDRDDDTGDIMRCFDLQTGRELWRFANNSPGSVSFPGSRSVPIVDDRHVYAVGLNGELLCIDVNTEKLVWNRNIWSDFGGTNIPFWAIAQSPLIYGDLLVVASQTQQAGVVAYNKNTGSIVWQTPALGNPTQMGYVSPKVVKIHGEDHIVMITSSTNPVQNPNAEITMGNVVGIDPLTGKILWQYVGWNCHISVSCAVDAGNNKLLIAGGYSLGATMIQVNKQTDGTFHTFEIFTTEEFGDQTKPPLLHEGYFYAMYRTNNKRDGLVCMNMEGQIMWKTGRNPDFDRGSMILADGLILATDGMNSLYLIEPDPKGYKQIAKAEIFRAGTQNWAPIALADGKLLIRDQNKMLCLKVTQ